jgi:hypothetical protein
MNEVMKELRPANPPSYEVTYELHNFYKPNSKHEGKNVDSDPSCTSMGREQKQFGLQNAAMLCSLECR